jgi:hypothetical protein
MRTITVCASALLLSSVAVSQQTIVFPTQAVSAEGDAAVADHTGGLPWWSNPSQAPNAQNFHMQLISDLPSTVQGSISKLSYRRDGAFEAGWGLEQFSVELEVTMSTSPNRASTASPTFSANMGGDAVKVISRKNVVFGTRAFVGSFPEPFQYSLVLDQAFPYDASKGSLCMDVLHYGNDMMHPLRLTPLTVAADAMTGSTQSAKLEYGSRCFGDIPWVDTMKLHTEMFIDDSSGSPIVKFFAWRQNGMHHSQGFLIASPYLGPVPIPVPNLVVPGCGTIDVDLAAQTLFAISSSNERGMVRWPTDPTQYLVEMPWDPQWAGQQFYTQELNRNVHTQKYSATNWVLTQVPVYLGPGVKMPLRVVHSDGATSHGNATGTVGPLGLGPVIEYTY